MNKYNFLIGVIFVVAFGLFASTSYADRVYYDVYRLDEDNIRIELKVEGQELSGNVYPVFYELKHGNILTIGYKMADGKYHKPYLDFDLRKTRDTLMILLYTVGDDIPVHLTDIQDVIEKEHILHLYDSRIIEGKENREFGPDENVTLAEFVTMVCRSLGIEPLKKKEDEFEDLEEHWAQGYLLASVKQGFIDINDNNIILPNEKIDLANASSIIDRAFDLKVHVDGEYDKLRQGKWFSDSIKKMFDARLMYVFESIYYINFYEEKKLTRADVAMLISRAKLNVGIIGVLQASQET